MNTGELIKKFRKKKRMENDNSIRKRCHKKRIAIEK